MDADKIKRLLAEAVDGLTGEQKEKAKTCRDAGELLAFLSEAGASLPDELLDAAAGGGGVWDDYFAIDELWWERVQKEGIDAYDFEGQNRIWQEVSDEYYRTHG